LAFSISPFKITNTALVRDFGLGTESGGIVWGWKRVALQKLLR
jgi:hypothetical protein